MSKSPENVWFQLGYALEVAGRRAPSQVKVRARHGRLNPLDASTIDQILAAGTGVVYDRLLALLSGRRPETSLVARAALAGAGAAVAISLLRYGANGSSNSISPNNDSVSELLAAAGQGILYGTVIDPRLPGPALLRGATFGVIDYVASPYGGLDRILGASSPQRISTLLAVLLTTVDSPSCSLVEHIAFGATLGLLYGDERVRIGKRDAE
ncbi:uncharacterized protein METZ01_LOCUS457132 [marine metagenome]|uniref:Uncharacterized protein n=1 Tax=marine metagenome TaxID=408172 RepID=A0A383AB14_9ZZZZ